MTGPYAGYQQGASYSANADRDILSSLLYRKLVADESVPVAGVIYGGTVGNLFNYLPSGWNTTVERGRAVVDDYVVVLPQSVTLTFDASTSTARRDLVILRVRDQEAGDLVDNATVEIVKGTTSADPAIPARSLVLGAVNIRASSTSLVDTDLVDRRVFTAANGGMVVAADLNNGNPATLPVDAPLGAIIFDYTSGYHHKMTRDGIRPLSPVGSVIFYNLNYLIGEAVEWGPGTLTKHPNTVGDTSFATSPAANQLLLGPAALYTITFTIEMDRYQTGPGWIGIQWAGAPSNFRAGIPQFPAATTSATIQIGPPENTVINFVIKQISGGNPHVNSVITVTRWT